MRVLHVASECYPLIKTGGLADVVGALPKALAELGVETRVMLPNYPAVQKTLQYSRVAGTLSDLFGGPARILETRAPMGLDLILLDADHLFARPGNPYLGPDGRDWPDNPLRFAALSRAAAESGAGRLGDWRPDIVHAHDWQAGLTAAYLRAGRTGNGPLPATIMTVHNIAFQGLLPGADRALLGLPEALFTSRGLEYFGQVSALKAGLVYSDRLTTVSPTYAGETQTPEFGMGMEGILKERSAQYCGILNGIDLAVWNPKTDPHIVSHYSRKKPGAKAANKKALQDEMGISVLSDAPLFGVVSRLTAQKGLDLLASVVPKICDCGGQLVLLGAGEPQLEAAFSELKKAHLDRCGIRIGYDEGLSHRIQAGADFLLVPSRFEPCGLTQLYGLRYGAVPVVARTGGLADTVIDANDAALAAGIATGIQFHPTTAHALSLAIDRALRLYSDKKAMRKVRSRAMAHPVSWEKSASEYLALYNDILNARSMP